MPIYEYECSCCGARFEERRNFGEDGGALCPRCQGHAHKLLSAVSIIFKGSGFYVTDYPKSGQPNLGTAKAPPGNGGSAGGEGGKTPPASGDGAKAAAATAKAPATTAKVASPVASSKEG